MGKVHRLPDDLANRAAWQDDGVNRIWGDFYRNTRITAETALLRPRFDGYIAFQTAASECIRAALERREEPEITLAALRGLWRSAPRGDGHFNDMGG